MPEDRTFRGFFSYAHHDAITDPRLIDAFTTGLERRVSAKLVNARFGIWRDTQGLRTGEHWNEKIERELRNADVFILLLTPQWISSDFCNREYTAFEQVEALRSAGKYVAPILARSLDQQAARFTDVQREIYARIVNRQYFKAPATDFLRLSMAQRTRIVDDLADDIAGMLERLRDLARTNSLAADSRLTSPDMARGRQPRAQNYAEVDFVRSYEIVIDGVVREDDVRSIYAQVDFVEKLFIKTSRSYVEFGVAQAYLTIFGTALSNFLKSDHFRARDSKRVNYVILHDMPEALSVSIVATTPGETLAELALPPTDGNYWCNIGSVVSRIKSAELSAELRVSFSVDGLLILNEQAMPQPSPALKRKIEAIIGVAMQKNERVAQDGQVRRKVPVRERL